MAVLVVHCVLANHPAAGQISSLGARQRSAGDVAASPQTPPSRPEQPKTHPVYEVHSWISMMPPAPKAFRVHDLLTVIVRQQRKFEADADLKTEKEFDLNSQLDAFLKFTQGGVGAATFRRGKPNIDYRFDNELKTKGDTSREDKLITRLTATIIDVKPNGTLVIEGRGRIEHDDESSTITIIGTCRKEDVTADNTVLSTQVADLEIVVANAGALRKASSRGWIPKLLDMLSPF